MAEIKRLHGGYLIALGVLVVVSGWIAWLSLFAAKQDFEHGRITAQGAEELTAFSSGSLLVALVFLIGFTLLWGFFHVPIGHIAITSGGRVFGAGWKWHPLARILSLELIDMKSRNYKVPPFPVRTRSQAEFDMHVAVNWRPDPKNISTYIEHGREAVVETLGNMLTSRLTNWAYNAGPSDWRDALGSHGLSKEALVDELSHVPPVPRSTKGLLMNQDGQLMDPNAKYIATLHVSDPVTAIEPATSSLLVPGDIATFQFKQLGIIIGGVYVKHIEPRSGSRFQAKDLMEEADYNLPFQEQLDRVEKDIEDIDKLEKKRAAMLLIYPGRKREIDRKFDMLKTLLFDK